MIVEFLMDCAVLDVPGAEVWFLVRVHVLGVVEGQDGPATIEDSCPCRGWKPWTKAGRLGQRLRSQGQVSVKERDVAPGTDSV